MFASVLQDGCGVRLNDPPFAWGTEALRVLRTEARAEARFLRKRLLLLLPFERLRLELCA